MYRVFRETASAAPGVARYGMALALVGGLAATLPAQVITSLDDSVLPRAGRLVIRGSGFGAVQQPGWQVRIGGHNAPVAFWSDTKVKAYVPETAPIGTVDVQIIAAAASNSVPLEVTMRPPPDGRLRWAFPADDQMIMSQPAVAADGMIYVTGTFGHLYALTPDGGVKWVRQGVAGNRSPDIGPDGTIYVTEGNGGVSAIDPATGATIWSVTPPGGGVYIGPNVGPDGNIYAVMDLGVGGGPQTGAFVVSPTGQLLDSFDGNFNIRASPLAWEIGFGPNHWYITSGMGGPVQGEVGLFAFELGGANLAWSAGGRGTPLVGPSGNVFISDPDNNRVVSYDPGGNTRWEISLNVIGGIPAQPGLGPDETFYMPTLTFSRLHAINPDGTFRWTRLFESHLYPVVRRDNRALVTIFHDAPGPFEARAYDPATGDPLWEQVLPMPPNWFGEFAPDDRTLYIGTVGTIGDDPVSFVLAIDTSLAGDHTPGDIDGDGDVDLIDLSLLLNAFGTCDGDVGFEPAADFDGSGCVDLVDLSTLLGSFGS